MKIFISADMEGITGVTGRTDVVEGQAGYERCRRLMTGDVNAAIEGAFEGGATEVVVNDSHWAMRNILLEELDSRAQLISGSPKPLSMMQGVDESFAGAFFIGYHAMAGTKGGVISHTILGKEIIRIRMNGREMGETGINAAIAGHYNTPVALVTGDDMVCAEAKNLLPNVEVVTVKEGIGRWAAKCLTPGETRRRIKDAAGRALCRLDMFTPYKVCEPVTFEVEFASPASAQTAALIPGVRQFDARTVSVTEKNMISAFSFCLGIIRLGLSAADELYG